MNLDFKEAIKRVNEDAQSGNAVMEYVRDARPPAEYILQQLLPERLVASYTVKNGNMTIRATMAGVVGMDSDNPEGGIISTSTFLQDTYKFGHAATLPEQAIRQIQMLIAGGGKVDLAEEVLNFTDKLLLQPHLDTFEWLRGQIFTTGKIDWTFNGINVKVDYQLPVDHIFPTRTGEEAYGGSNSKFWDDIRLGQRQQDNQVARILTHPDTMDVILANPTNRIKVVNRVDNKYGSTYTITKYQEIDGNTVESSDARDTVEIQTYNMEGEVFNPNNQEETINVPFFSGGKLTFVGNDVQRGYRVGEGSTENPDYDDAIGYTHIGPTSEGGLAPGRYATVYTPQQKKMQLRGEAVTNGLPVVETPSKISIASTDMPN